MPEITLEAEIGRPLGSAASRRLRAEGKIPGVVYGHGTEPVPVLVAGRDVRIALNGEAGTNALLSLKAGDTTYLAVARVLQRHPVRGTVTHIDFQIVRRDEVISADVPVILVGEALAVHNGDGLVDQQLLSLTVKATPGQIPTSIEIDITKLQLGGAIRVGDLKLPDGVTTDFDDEMAIVSGVAPRVATGTAGAAESGEEGDATEASAGAEGGDEPGAEG
jgi:large subunit ribosomal protein L25